MSSILPVTCPSAKPNAIKAKFEILALGLTFPYRPDGPTGCPQLLFVTGISCLIGTKFIAPEFRTGRGHLGDGAAFVMMPEAPMHEDYRPVPREDDVGATWQVAAVQAEPVSEPM